MRFHSILALILFTAGVFTVIAEAAQNVGRSNVRYEGSAVGNPERGEHVAEAKCGACHGPDGNSPDRQYPKLAGQDPAYLYWQLWAFKRGTRRSDVMSGIVATLSDADMADAASFYGRQMRKTDAVKDPRLAAIGERIFFGGMPPCAMCHGSTGEGHMPMMGRMPMMGHGMMGMMGSGMMAHIPKLNGQHATYIIDQLNRFAAGERQGKPMNRVAAALSEMDKRAVAEFLSGAP